MSIFIVPVNQLYAIISNEIYFQSILFDSDGTVASNGQYTLTFSLWDGELPTDNKLWEEQHTVSVENGTYVVSLGSTDLVIKILDCVPISKFVLNVLMYACG